MTQKSSLQSWQKIYVNRSLNMASIKSIGFDMDHTLALYNRESFETLKKFIHAGYPAELSELKFDPNFVIRGLLVDTHRGNLLKVDGHKYVKVAFHGRHKLNKAERHQTYNAQSFKADKFLSIDTFFALSEVQLYFEIIDYMRLNPGQIAKNYHEVYQDLRRFIDLSHADGSIKNEVVAHPELYFISDPTRFKSLTRFRDGGKKLFLLTNSKWDYTNAVMSYLFDKPIDGYGSWRDLFHHIIVASAKPSFFTGSQPFYEVIPETGLCKPHLGGLLEGRIYAGGNGKLFETLTQQKGDEILYCGDHIFGDIIRSKERYNWRTLLVVEELMDELKESSLHREDWEAANRLLHEREAFDEEVQKIRSRIQLAHRQLESTPKSDAQKLSVLTKKIDQLDSKLAEFEASVADTDSRLDELIKAREARIHPIWGDPFRVGFEKSRFSRQIEAYACLYTSDVGNLRFYSPFKRFHSVHDKMPHDL